MSRRFAWIREPWLLALILSVAGAQTTRAGQVYWTDYQGGDIRRANDDGTNPQTLVTGLNHPIGIALDLAGGKMYWADQFANDIRRANLAWGRSHEGASDAPETACQRARGASDAPPGAALDARHAVSGWPLDAASRKHREHPAPRPRRCSPPRARS